MRSSILLKSSSRLSRHNVAAEVVYINGVNTMAVAEGIARVVVEGLVDEVEEVLAVEDVEAEGFLPRN